MGSTSISPDIIGPGDPTTLRGVAYAGTDSDGGDYLFDVRIGGFEIEFRVNPEFKTRQAARRHADTFAAHFGRMPAFLLSTLREVWIRKGESDSPFFAGNGFVIVHTDRNAGDNVEEFIMHELGHVSLDEAHRLKNGWRLAQLLDPASISLYARRYLDREDIAESIVAWFAARVRPDRLPPGDLVKILETIPNRLAYFDKQGFDLAPYRMPGS